MSSTTRYVTRLYNLAERYLDITQFTMEMQELESFLQGTIPWIQIRNITPRLEREIEESDSYCSDPDVIAFDGIITEMEEYITRNRNLTPEQKRELDDRLCPFVIEGQLIDTDDLEEHQIWLQDFKERVAQNPIVSYNSEPEYTSEDEYSEEETENGFTILRPRITWTIEQGTRNWLDATSSSSEEEEESDDEEDEDSKHYIAARAA